MIIMETVAKLVPQADASLVACFTEAEEVLGKRGICDSELRLAHFMAQVLADTDGLRSATESMNHGPERIMNLWPQHFRCIGTARLFARNNVLLAEKVYGGRMGNDKPKDGFKYRGRGLLKITGKASYAELGKIVGVDLVTEPELVLDPRYCLAIAAEEWHNAFCNEAADDDDIEETTKLITGGLKGLKQRKNWLERTKAVKWQQ